MQANPISKPQSACHSQNAWVANPWQKSGGFSDKWIQLCLILSCILLANAVLSYFFEGSLDIYFTCFAVYLWMTAGMLLYIYTTKRDELIQSKSSCLYPKDTWIENTEGSPVLCFTYSLGTPYRKNASYAAQIAIRNIRHLYLDRDSRAIFVDGDFTTVRTDQKKAPAIIRHGAWIYPMDPNYPELFYQLHHYAHLNYEPLAETAKV